MQESKVSKKSDNGLKVLVVDDSPMMCKVIEQILKEDEQIGHVTKAFGGKEALQTLANEKFDVCTLDVHMPGMNGLSVLKNIMIKFPLPTLMVSAFTSEGSRITFEALRFGAVDFFKKPVKEGEKELKEQAENLRSSLKRASKVQVGAARYLRIKPVIRVNHLKNYSPSIEGVGIIYGSTGSYSSLLSIIPHLSTHLAIPILVSMTIEKDKLEAFIEYLQPYTALPLHLAQGTMTLLQKNIYFLPNEYAAHFDKKGDEWKITVEKRPIKAKNEGAIDLTLLSASEAFGANVLSVFVSGDDNYGLTGAKELKRNKGLIVVQHPSECLSPSNPQLLIQELGSKEMSPLEIAHMLSYWKT